MRRDFQRFFEPISVLRIRNGPGYSNYNDYYCEWNLNGCRLASCALSVHGKSRVLLFEFQHTPVHLYIYICLFIYLLCMGDIILTTSQATIFIFLVFVVKHTFVDPIQPHESFVISVKCLSLKYLSKIIIFHISCCLVDNSADVLGIFQSLSLCAEL